MAVNLCFRVRKGLPPNKKSIFGDFSLRTLITLSIVFNVFMNIVSANEEISCSNVSNAFAAKEMLSIVDIKSQPDSDVGGLCSNRGCCGAGALPQLQARARAQLDGALRSELGKLADVLANRAQKFDDFFRRLLRESREEFHAMFKRTYGMIYEQHSYVFERLFERLERYYARGDADLVRTMDNFFGVLYQKMFTVLNSQYNFDDKYLKCVSEHMRDTQPFEDVPHKLSVQLRRAFVATRTFHKALRAGADVVRAMQQIGVSSGCGAWWARLRWCGACAGTGVPACGRYCHNVLRACLAHHADIEQHWDAYVDAVEKVADRLLGPFNIVMVVEPIDIKISEAIMNFQEHNQEISQKIFAGCGKPVLGGSGGAGPFFAPPERTRRSLRYERSVPDVDWRPDVGDVDDFEIEASYESVLHRHPQLLLQSAEDMPRSTARLAEQAAARGRFLRYMRGEINSEELEDRDRRRRDADPGPAAEPSPSSSEIDFKQYEFEGPKSGTRKKNNKKSNPSKNGDTSSWGGPALEGLVREARARVRNSRRYWPQLPYVLCAGDTAPPTPNAPCFNGTHVASYTADRAGVGTAALASNPEVRWAGSSAVVGELDVSSQGARAVLAAVSAQQEALRALTAKLKDAYNGVDVQWRDDDDLTAAPAHMDLVEVAGSGSGSGDDMDITDDDEDRNPSSYYPEGSGQRPPDDDQEPDAKEPDEEDEEEVPDRPTETETPFTPVVVGGVDGGNGNVPLSPPVVHGAGVDTDDLEPDDSLPDDTKTRADLPPPPPPGAGPAPGSTPERGVPGAADRPSLERALFAYALPVVCAWFGTIVTDLF